MGFVERFSSFPSTEALLEIEGVATVDEQPAAQITGISQGVACLVGEFADVTLGVSVDANGVVTTSPQPTELFGAQDQLNKLGGFDETIGEFGGDMGNGFIELSQKAFARLVVVVVNLASSQGARVWRKLPTSASTTNPTGVVPLAAATVPAGREFRSGSNRVRVAQRVQFSALPEYKSAADGSVTAAGGAAAFQTFNTPGGGLSTVVRPDGTVGVQVGDALVLGVIGGAAGMGSNADTYRVRTVVDDQNLTVEKQDGSNFNWTTTASMPWRLHTAECADSGGAFGITSQSGFRVPMRPLDATIAANTLLSPTVAPPALTATGADPLSGLTVKTDTTTGLVFTSAIQAPNAPSSASFDALYSTAVDALLPDDLPEREVNLVWSARCSAAGVIRAKLANHVLTQKISGIGRVMFSAPPLDTTAVGTVLGDATPGVGANRAEEETYQWPGVQIFVREAVGVNVKGADQLLYKNGLIDVPSSSFAAAVMSQLPPEHDPGQQSDPVKTIMSAVRAIQRGVSGLDVGVYKRLRAQGIMAPRIDRSVGPIFQSGVTTSLLPGQKAINRRRFSFFIEDSIADVLVLYAKEPMSEALKDQIVSALHDFFDGLLSEKNPKAARIRAYTVDAAGGNTKELTNAGIFVVRYAVEMIPIALKIVQQASVGLGVVDIQNLAA